MSLFEDTNPRELKELLGQIYSGEAALPDFQRDFVWDPMATQELIVSIAANYPAGSLLRIRNTHNLFAYREFQGAPPLNGRGITYLVLDGQQRLTSLYQAFYGVGDHRYFLNVKKLIQGLDFEECIFHLRTNHKRTSAYEDLEAQARDLVLPLSILKGGAGGFSKWTRNVARKTETELARLALEDKLSEIEEKYIQTVDDYRFPVVTLSDQTGAEAVCTIFETLNRTGVKLSPFELLTARFWPKNVNLRQLWEKAKTDYPIIADFEIDPYYILQTVALASRKAPSCKRGDVLDLEASVIEEWWDKAIKGLVNSLEILRDDCGVTIPNWLPYNTIVAPFAAILSKTSLPSGPQAGANRQKLTRWFWCSVFGQTYENAPNSQSAKDVTDVVNWLNGGEIPESVRSLQFDPQVLRDTTARQRALYRGVIALILSHSPRDFYNGAKITGDLMVEHNIDDHHIFPNAYLERQKIPSRLRDCVINRTLIDRKTNIRIRDRAPSDYLQEIKKELKEKFKTLLESHLIPSEPNSAVWRDEFEAFLDWRQIAIWEEIKKVTGLESASNLMSDEE